MLESSFGINFFMKTRKRKHPTGISTLDLRWMVCGKKHQQKRNGILASQNINDTELSILTLKEMEKEINDLKKKLMIRS